MSDGFLITAVLAAVTIVVRAAGPVLIGGRELHPRTLGLIALLSPALLAGLMATEALGDGEGGLVLDARVLGLAAAGAVLMLRRDAMLVAVGAAVIVTVSTRALAGA